jgi:hypothetical protein
MLTREDGRPGASPDDSEERCLLGKKIRPGFECDRRPFSMSGVTATVVGVSPPRFTGVTIGEVADFARSCKKGWVGILGSRLTTTLQVADNPGLLHVKLGSDLP